MIHQWGLELGGFCLGSLRCELACLCYEDLKAQLSSYLLGISLLNYFLIYLVLTILYF